MLRIRIFFLTLIISGFYTAKAQTSDTQLVDSIVNKALVTFNVPGIAVSVIKDNRVLLNKGYGYRSVNPKRSVDENTLFGIASNSKAFTAAALAILVDKGKLKWDDRLVKYIPEFKMYDPYVTKEFTITDMLSHRSGLGLGAGDLLHNPDSTDFTIKDVISSLRYLKPEASFRSRYAYDNIFYLVAAELVRRVTGENWGNFIQDQIFQPLKMNRSKSSFLRAAKDENVIAGYDELDGKLVKIKQDDSEKDNGAGGIYASAADMSKWMLVQLNNGCYGDGLKQQLFSASAQENMWKPQIFIPVSKNDSYDSHFGAYGLGWFLNDAKGYKVISHTGQDDGMISEVLLIPELHAGVSVLTNRDGGGAVRAIIDQLSDYFLNVKNVDRTAYWKARVDARVNSADTAGRSISNNIAQLKISPSDIKKLRGNYNDNWFGPVTIFLNDGRLFFRSSRSLQLHGEILAYKPGKYFIKWADRSLQADAFLISNPDGTSFTMARALPETPTAYDFQDLHFRKIR